MLGFDGRKSEFKQIIDDRLFLSPQNSSSLLVKSLITLQQSWVGKHEIKADGVVVRVPLQEDNVMTLVWFLRQAEVTTQNERFWSLNVQLAGWWLSHSYSHTRAAACDLLTLGSPGQIFICWFLPLLTASIIAVSQGRRVFASVCVCVCVCLSVCSAVWFGTLFDAPNVWAISPKSSNCTLLYSFNDLPSGHFLSGGFYVC